MVTLVITVPIVTMPIGNHDEPDNPCKHRERKSYMQILKMILKILPYS